MNRKNKVSCKTPFGMTERKLIEKIVMQGVTWSPLKCSCVVDKVGADCLTEHKYVYVYKEKVEITPLSYVDDLLALVECGVKSVETNSYINRKIECHKLWFGEAKCHSIHVGEQNENCPALKIHPTDSGRKGNMLKVTEDKYVGDLISESGTNKRNIEDRVSKAIGLMSQVLAILNDTSLGYHYFEIFVTLRNVIFISSFLTNCECWYNVTEGEIRSLEDVDKTMIRRALNLPFSTPVEFLYNELGIMRIRDIIQYRRVMFLHYLLNRPEQELLYRFFMAQLRDPTEDDWCLTVQDDLQQLNITLSFDDIKALKKEKYKSIVKEAIEKKAFQDLQKMKENHSKGKEIVYGSLQMRKYLTSTNISVEKAKLLLQLRSRMAPFRENYRGMYPSDSTCPLCESGTADTQQHIIACPEMKLQSSEKI